MKNFILPLSPSRKCAVSGSAASSLEGIKNRYAKWFVGIAGLCAPSIAAAALVCTPSAATTRSPVTMVPSARVIEPASGFYVEPSISPGRSKFQAHRTSPTYSLTSLFSTTFAGLPGPSPHANRFSSVCKSTLWHQYQGAPKRPSIPDMSSS